MENFVETVQAVDGGEAGPDSALTFLSFPARLAFLVTMMLRFLPMIARDAREIHALQILRGAPVRPRDLLNPLNWRDGCQSLAIPLMIRTLSLADQVSVAARQLGVEAAADLPRAGLVRTVRAVRRAA